MLKESKNSNSMKSKNLVETVSDKLNRALNNLAQMLVRRLKMSRLVVLKSEVTLLMV